MGVFFTIYMKKDAKVWNFHGIAGARSKEQGARGLKRLRNIFTRDIWRFACFALPLHRKAINRLKQRRTMRKLIVGDHTKKVLMTAVVLATVLTAGAQTKKAVVTVGQQQLTETVTKLTFDDDKVVLHLANGTTQTVDMETVTIVFTVVDALKVLESEAKDAPLAYFDMSGRQLKKAPKKGSYIIKKGTKVVKVLKN